ELHAQQRLAVLRGHAEETDDPHPEERALATDTDGQSSTGDVADTDRGCQSRTQCLVVRDVALDRGVLLAPDQGEPERMGQPQELEQLQADGEEQADTEQQRDEDEGSPEHLADDLGHPEDLIHAGISVSRSDRGTAMCPRSAGRRNGGRSACTRSRTLDEVVTDLQWFITPTSRLFDANVAGPTVLALHSCAESSANRLSNAAASSGSAPRPTAIPIR